MHNIANKLKSYRCLKQFYNDSKIKGPAISLAGLSVSNYAHIISSFCYENNCKSLVLVPNTEVLKQLAEDLANLGSEVYEYPDKDVYLDLDNIEYKSSVYEHIRMECLSQILERNNTVVISTLTAALQYTIPRNIFVKNCFKLKSGQIKTISDLLSDLVYLQYENCYMVEKKGQFSVRGDIVDIYPIGLDTAIRLEFFDDEIESISKLDLDSQRRGDKLEEIKILPAKEIIYSEEELLSKIKTKNDNLSTQEINLKHLGKYFKYIYDEKETLFDYFNDNTVIFCCDERQTYKEFRKNYADLDNKLLNLSKENKIKKEDCNAFANIDYFLNEIIKKYFTVYLDHFPVKYELTPEKNYNFTIKTKKLDLWNGSMTALKSQIKEINKDKSSIIVILAGGTKFAQNTANIIKEETGLNVKPDKDLTNMQPGCVYILDNNLSSGFYYLEANIYVISRGYIKNKTNSKKTFNKKVIKDISNIGQLNIGEYVVHNQHGIGKFEGIKTLEMQGIAKDYLKIIYAKSDILYVPVTQLNLVAKYMGAREGSRVTLNKLGSSDWGKAKKRAKTQAKNIAKDLIKIYSERTKTPGHAFPLDGTWQKDFEASFPYEETDSQLRCCEEIKKDMEKTYPMDRLLCGDVGFGKTEVALRAAFKCVSDGKQCAILVPTTILAWQHYNTMLERFKNFPIKVEMLSRFRSKKEQTEILKQLKIGNIDIIVGTHRMVQDDVTFRDLGLLVIDEEQRFGVLQKEKIKSLVKGTDILTLTATPIPRTLNMALSGIRDMSSLEEAPRNRYPVQTQVLEYDQNIINEAIKKEIDRGGQIYYLYNRIENLQNVATKLLNNIPNLRLSIAHSQMSEEQLSKVWKKLIDKEIDLLLCTTIIEAGVDVPNVNTLIVENADNFGLAQLYQIRGRIGRSNKKAYAYFCFKKDKSLSEMAMKRLNAICDFTEFGSGFKIAMKDLELRGAGNILGGEQHGHMESVGYDMYVKLLSEALEEEKGTKNIRPKVDCFIDVNIQSHIPENYIDNLNQRLEIYRKIADIRDDDTAEEIKLEIEDRYGKLPKSLIKLIRTSKLRSKASELCISEIRQTGHFIVFKLSSEFKGDFTKIIKEMGERISFNNTAVPYFSVKLKHDDNILDLIEEVILLLK